MRQCLIMSAHTKYQFLKYNTISEIPKDWLKKHIGNYLKESELLPRCPFDGIELKGYKYYKVYQCGRGILQYYNNEIGFFYNTGSYMYIRFLYHNDCEEYLKLLLKDYGMELKQNFCINKYELNCGDIITPLIQIPLEIDTEFYEDMLGLPRGSTTLEYFDKKKKEDIDQEGALNGHYFQVQTIIDDEDGVFVVPALIPDVIQFRLKGVPNAKYFTVGPNNMATPIECMKVEKNFEDDSKELPND